MGSDLTNASFWSNVSLWLGAVVAVLAIYSSRLANEEAAAQKAELDKFKSEAASKIASANKDAAEANANAARANEKAAQLEKEAAWAKLELARVDPINRPIGSIQIELSVTAHGPVDEKMISMSLESPLISNIPTLQFMSGKESLVALTRTRLTHHPIIYNNDRNNTAHQFFMTFSWPRGDIISSFGGIHAQARDWLEKEAVTIAMFDETITGLACYLLGVGEGVTLSDTNCIVIINGSTIRRFNLPEKTSAAGYISMAPQRGG